MQKEITYSDLLTRNEHTFDESKINQHLKGKRVFVTGAGGSIGSAISKRISQADVAKLCLVDSSEIALFNYLSGDNIRVPDAVYVLDISSRQIPEILEKEKPDIVIHAAAYKHVGLMEGCPDSAFDNNTRATIRFAERARDKGVSQFLFVSTDKAVNPSSYMGASKRLAEAWLFTHAREYAKVCRFGNVLGSSGSLIEIAIDKLSRGLPLTVTHPACERYFITPDEAVGLLLTSLTLPDCGPFTVEMGAPVSIVVLLKKLAALLDKPLEMEFSKVGAGEKIAEELIADGETWNTTAHSGIFDLKSPSFGNISRLIQSVGTEHMDMVDAANTLEIGNEDMFAL